MEALCAHYITGRSTATELVRKGRKRPSEHIRTLGLDLGQICKEFHVQPPPPKVVSRLANIEFITSFHPSCDVLIHPAFQTHYVTHRIYVTKWSMLDKSLSSHLSTNFMGRALPAVLSVNLGLRTLNS